ncbi:hypothetical protein AKJ09_03553 [Labilithrix luteola]|uniref:Uncharacterized protein n=1 Tax=Labilithrix luteola TaxID=1391654 RepID=A0A0K1PUS9_9BACT|nr:hypothetical protein [Labilithrix luteola]AKU96889.1 hypothetical protein AKJ09_03553 [Labilithrix luteola]
MRTLLLVPFALVVLGGCETVIGADFDRSLRSADAGANDKATDSSPTAPGDRNADAAEAGAKPGKGDASASDPGDSPRSGPGRAGALPAGYCCASDSECRSRVCRPNGDGTSQCAEQCGTRCAGGACSPACPGQTPDGVCSADYVCTLPRGVACRDPNTFERGAGKFGDSCWSDADCDGNLCLSFEQQPARCTQGCSTSNECPSKACIGEGVCDVR